MYSNNILTYCLLYTFSDSIKTWISCSVYTTSLIKSYIRKVYNEWMDYISVVKLSENLIRYWWWKNCFYLFVFQYQGIVKMHCIFLVSVLIVPAGKHSSGLDPLLRERWWGETDICPIWIFLWGTRCALYRGLFLPL